MFENDGMTRTRLPNHLGFCIPEEPKDTTEDVLSQQVNILGLEIIQRAGYAEDKDTAVCSYDNMEDFFNYLLSPKADTPISNLGNNFGAGETALSDDHAKLEFHGQAERSVLAFDDAVQHALVAGDYKGHLHSAYLQVEWLMLLLLLMFGVLPSGKVDFACSRYGVEETDFGAGRLRGSSEIRAIVLEHFLRIEQDMRKIKIQQSCSYDNGEDFFNYLLSSKADTPISTPGNNFGGGETALSDDHAKVEFDGQAERTVPAFDDAVQQALGVGYYKGAVAHSAYLQVEWLMFLLLLMFGCFLLGKYT
ncbi:hypothetical protein Nepgr_006240 [Nepenthes gracilis]|uniref:Uncharacterized protein n=1 Tax=Nepenthes gracilis TaxID=150966 RepID=A0AAD3S507_NEPGR|nr:hypothetical protein Nepgr_006240 [Nepenthes gracilis]